MKRREFLKQCAGGLCTCAAASAIAPATALASDAKPPEDWRLPFVKRRYAKLVDILSAQTDEKTVDAILIQLGRSCAAEFGMIQQHAGDIDGFITEFRKLTKEEVSYDRTTGVVKVVGAERGDCFCPLVDSHKTSARACNCSLGWQQYTYETLLGKKVTVELKESVLRGGKRCVFEIHIGAEKPGTTEPA